MCTFAPKFTKTDEMKRLIQTMMFIMLMVVGIQAKGWNQQQYKQIEQSIRMPQFADKEYVITKFGAKAEVNLRQDGEKTIGNAKISDVGLNFNLNATINGDEQQVKFDDKFSMSKVGAEAYLKNDTLYVDYSGSALRKAVDSVSSLVNHINQEIPHEEGEPVVTYDFNKSIDEATGAPERKIANPWF